MAPGCGVEMLRFDYSRQLSHPKNFGAQGPASVTGCPVHAAMLLTNKASTFMAPGCDLETLSFEYSRQLSHPRNFDAQRRPL